MTIQEVAEASGLSSGFISMVERNKTSTSIASLLRICRSLSIDIGSLFQRTGTKVVRASERRYSRIAGEGILDYPLSPAGPAALEALETHVEPGGSPGSEPYGFAAETEFVYVLEGEIQFHLNGESILLKAGDALTFQAYQPHTWVNPSETAIARVIFVIAPPAWTTSSGVTNSPDDMR